MAQLTVRNVDDAIAAALKARAARAGRSAEAEHRRILEAALRPGADTDFFDRALEALEDQADIRAAAAARNESDPRVAHADVMAEFGL